MLADTALISLLKNLGMFLLTRGSAELVGYLIVRCNRKVGTRSEGE